MSDTKVIKSRVSYQPAKSGSNVARELLEALKRHQHRTLLLDANTKRTWTGERLLSAAGSIASGLIKQVELRPGDVVLSICEHTDNELLLALGILLAGGAIFGSVPSDSYDDEKTLCSLVRPSLIVIERRLHAMATRLKDELPELVDTRIVWIDQPAKQDQNNNNNSSDMNGNFEQESDRNHKASSFQELLDEKYDEQLIERVANEQIKANSHMVTYMLTSGSTGKPKAVGTTHEQMLHQLYSTLSAARNPLNDVDLADDKTSRLLMPLSESSIVSGDLPLDHGAGVNIMLSCILLGAKLVVIRAFDERSFWRAIDEHRISFSVSSATFGYKLLSHLKELIESNQHSKMDLSCLRSLQCVGAKLTYLNLVEQIRQVYPQLQVSQAYGMTEIGFMAALCSCDLPEHIQSVGYLFPSLKVKVVDQSTGELLGPNQRGELHVWAPGKFTSYSCVDGQQAELICADCHDEQGFFKTGDQVHIDQQGRLFVHGRFKDTLTLMQDWKIVPQELEELVDQHPLVEQSVVVGLPEESGCDAPRAFVKLISADSGAFAELQCENLKRKLIESDADFIAEDIYRFVAERCSEPKHLRGGVRILNHFPRVGLLAKIDRKALKLIR